MLDWEALTLFLLILMRMTGFVVLNPLIGRRGVPGVVQAGMVMVFAVTVFSFQGGGGVAVPDTLLEFFIRLLLEFVLGYLLGLVVNIFLYIPLLAGGMIDVQMGMSMGATYDPGSQSSITVTAHILNALMILLFFTANGHHTLFRILITSGELVPYGAVSLSPNLASVMVELFAACSLLGVKLCMPILMAEVLGQIGMGILMKVIPQINVFAINIELRVIVGLLLLLVLMAPMSEFLLAAEKQMLLELQRLLAMSG